MKLQKSPNTERHNGRLYKLSIDGSAAGAHPPNYRFSSIPLPFILKHPPGSNGQESNADGQRGKQSRRLKTQAGKTAKAAKEPRPLVLERRAPVESPDGAHSHVKELEALTQSLLHAREQQRQVISRELHDNIAQVLAAATNRISMAKEEKIPAWLRQELQGLRDQLKSALDDVRTLARELRPALLDHLGFTAALEKHADAFRERTRMTLDVRVDPDAVSFLENGHLTHLFRLAQEALQNIEDHSAAGRAWIDLTQLDGAVHLEIGDDGRAFTAERVAEAQRDGHLGLLGMRERAEMLGGRFLLQAVPDQGTVIRVSIPPRKTRDANALEQQS